MDETPTAVNEEVVADTTATESAPVETTSSEVADEFDGLGDISLTNPDEPEAKEETESKEEAKSANEAEELTEETKTEAQPQGKAEDRKQQLNNEIRDLVSQRNAIRAEVEKRNAEAYQPATDEELLGQINPETGEYYNSLEAKFAAMEQRQEIDRYNNQVAEAQLTLSSEANRALTEFPMFDENSKEYNPSIAAEVDAMLGNALVKDQNTGQIIGSNIPVYQLYKTIATSIRAESTKAQANAQKATAKMQANVDVSGGTPQKSSGDPMDDVFDRVKDFRFSA